MQHELGNYMQTFTEDLIRSFHDDIAEVYFDLYWTLSSSEQSHRWNGKDEELYFNTIQEFQIQLREFKNKLNIIKELDDYEQ